MQVVLPSRIADRHVGGNTTYTRALEAGLLRNGIRVGRIPSGKTPLRTLFAETTFGRQSQRDDVVLHYTADTGPLVRTVSPSVVTVHGIASRWTGVARNRIQESIWRARVRRAIAATDRVITVSNSSADDISAIFGVQRDRISVIYHGIEPVGRGISTEVSSDIRKRVPNDYVLYVGNIEPRKNLESLIDAFAFSGLSGMPLVIAGRPAWNYASILRSIESSPNVVYLGFVSESDKKWLIENCALFVFPSHYEGFGFPVLESLALGTPVLCSDRGSLAEVRGPARALRGLDAATMAVDIRLAIDDREWKESILKSGPAWASEFTWEKSVQRHIEVYREVLA